jgi:hypothetical protein
MHYVARVLRKHLAALFFLTCFGDHIKRCVKTPKNFVTIVRGIEHKKGQTKII